jgi:hypothetical protein
MQRDTGRPADAGIGRWVMNQACGIADHYTFLAMQLDAARYEASKDARELMRFPQ